MSEFDRSAARSDRDAAMDQIDANASEAWKAFIDEIIIRAARRYAFFTTDHVLHLAAEHNSPHVHDLRALGPRMILAHKSGVCQPTDRFELSRRRSRHAAPIRIWQSLIFGRG